MSPKRKQTGSALVISIMVVAFVEVLVVILLINQRLLIRQMDNLLTASQAYYYALGGEDWAFDYLKKSHQEKRKLKAQESSPKISIPNGYIRTTLTDMQSLYNLNNLSDQDEIPYFVNTLSALDTSLDEASLLALGKDIFEALTQASLISNPTTQGIQSPDSFNKLDTVSELRVLKNVSAEVLSKISPYLCALPQLTHVNINTASPEVLMSIVTLGQSDKQPIDDIIKARNTIGWFEGKAQFVNAIMPGTPDDNNRPIRLNKIAFNSQYYLASTQVVYKDMHLILHSLLYIQPVQVKDKFSVKILRRSRNTL